MPAEWKQRALDAEAALAAARQVDEAAITLIAAFKDVAEEARGHYGIEECAGPGQLDTEWDEIQGALASLAGQAAALLAALNALEPASEKPPRNPQHLEAEPEDPSVVDALVRVTGQLARLWEAAQTLLDVAAVVGAGPSEFAALRAALNPEPEGER